MVDSVVIFVPKEGEIPGDGTFIKKTMYVTDANLEAAREHVKQQYGEKAIVWFSQKELPPEQVVQAIADHHAWLKQQEYVKELEIETEGMTLEEQIDYLRKVAEAQIAEAQEHDRS